MSSRRKPSSDRRGNKGRNDSGGHRSGQRGTTPIRNKPSADGPAQAEALVVAAVRVLVVTK